MGSYKLTCHGVGGVCDFCGELPSDAVWAVFVGSYKLTWHCVGGVCGELQADLAWCGWCLWGVTS